MSLSEIISLDKSCNLITFYKNIYTNSLVFKTFLYSKNCTSFISQFTIVRIELKVTLIKKFLDRDNFTIKFMTTKVYN